MPDWNATSYYFGGYMLDLPNSHVGLFGGQLSPPPQEAFGGRVDHPEQGIVRS